MAATLGLSEADLAFLASDDSSDSDGGSSADGGDILRRNGTGRSLCRRSEGSLIRTQPQEHYAVVLPPVRS